MRNVQFEISYNQGYCWIAYEGGSFYNLQREIKYRGIPYKSVSFIAFKQGAEDAKNNKVNRYPS